MQTVTSKDGTRIAYDQSGQGPALILVPGATTTRRDVASVAAALSPSFTAIAYDRRGRGDSGDIAPYAVEREVEDIEALIDAAGGVAFVFGHSSGAVLSLDAALLIPTKISKLALYEPPLIVDGSRPHAPKNAAAHIDQLVSEGRRGEAVEYFMTLVGVPSEMIDQMRQSPMWSQLEALAPTMVYDMAIVQDVEQGDPQPLRKWSAVTVPTLIMDGTLFMGSAERHEFMRTGADELAAVLPDARRQVLEGQDHGAADDVLVPALKEFFLG